MPAVKDGKLELLTDKNSALVLVDYQPAMFAGVASGDKALIRTAATCAAKAAGILDVPVVLSAIGPQRNGEFIADITSLFPGKEYLPGRSRASTPLKTSQRMPHSKRPAGKKWLYQGCGRACALLTPPSMRSGTATRCTG